MAAAPGARSRRHRPVPHGRTARRLEWPHLPPRRARRWSSSGAAPGRRRGVAGRGLHAGVRLGAGGEDGRRHFVKAAGKAQRQFAAVVPRGGAQARGAARRRRAGAAAAVDDDDDEWVVLGIEYVDGALPRPAVAADDLDACLDALETVAAEASPRRPEPRRWTTFAEEFARAPSATGTTSGATRPGMPHLDEAAALARRLRRRSAGARHGRAHRRPRRQRAPRPPTGAAWICDWNWPVAGPAWLDSLFLLLGPCGDGLDVDEVFAQRRLLRGVPAETIDVVLAMLVRLLPRAATRPCRRPRRTSASTSAGRATSPGSGSATAAAGDTRKAPPERETPSAVPEQQGRSETGGLLLDGRLAVRGLVLVDDALGGGLVELAGGDAASSWPCPCRRWSAASRNCARRSSARTSRTCCARAQPRSAGCA